MNRHKNLMKTAQFAKICNVSKQTLIYYDKMDIFNPSYVDERGYRYYSLSQHETFTVISILRELNTPLKEIRKYLKNKNANSFLQLLDRKQNEVNKKIKELNQVSKIIEERKSITKNGLAIDNIEDVVINNMPEERIIISDYIRNGDQAEEIKVVSDLEKYIMKNSNKTLYIGAIVEKSKLIEGKYKNVTHFYAKINGNYKNTQVKPKGLYAITFNKGNYDTIHLVYKRLIDYIKINGYIIVGNSYEDTLLDFCTQKSEDEYITRVAIKVEKYNI